MEEGNMSYTITIAYDASAVKHDNRQESAPICGIYAPTNCAADMDVFEDTYYDTNVKGMGFGDEFDEFINLQVSHPGLVAAMKKATVDGSYVMVTEDPMMETMIDGLNKTLADSGFKFTFANDKTETNN